MALFVDYVIESSLWTITDLGQYVVCGAPGRASDINDTFRKLLPVVAYLR